MKQGRHHFYPNKDSLNCNRCGDKFHPVYSDKKKQILRGSDQICDVCSVRKESKMPPLVKAKQRSCLMCRKTFMSEAFSNRMCYECAKRQHVQYNFIHT